MCNERMSTKQAIAYLKELDSVFVTPVEASKCLNCNPQTLRTAAKNGSLNIEHQFFGRNLKIFTGSLIKKLGG